MPLTISLNDANNVGKITQIDLLSRHYSVSLIENLYDYDEKIGQMVKNCYLSEW